MGLIGHSGAGKSTLLRTVNGLVLPTEGTVLTLGEDLVALNEAGHMRLRRRIAMVFQEFALIARLSALTDVLVGRLGHVRTLPSVLRLFAAADIARARRAIRAVGQEGYGTNL